MPLGVFARYKEATIAGLPSERKIYADMSAPVYAAVAVYLTAKKHKVCMRDSATLP